MARRFKQARLNKHMKLTETAKIIGVSQPTLSAWEGERKEPNIETIKRLADLYDVSVEYLLGYDSFEHLSHSERIPVEAIRLFHAKPVWVPEKGWGLVNAVECVIVFTDGGKVPIRRDSEFYFAPPAYSEQELRPGMPLSRDELYTKTEVWVEPISSDLRLRELLRGRYTVKGEYVEDARGNRFFFDHYDAGWLAFQL